MMAGLPDLVLPRASSRNRQAEAAALLYTPVAGNALGVEDGPYFDVEINLRFEQVPGLCPQHGQQGQAAQGRKIRFAFSVQWRRFMDWVVYRTSCFFYGKFYSVS
jgi:hypothetical protein